MPVYTYTTIDNPLVNSIQAFGINDAGQVVGQYTSGSDTHSFLYSGGVFTPIDDPLGIGGTFATDINDAGQIVGYYVDANGRYHGFLYDPNAGVFPPYFTLNYPSTSDRTFAQGINDAGQIVGYYENATGNHGFLLSGGDRPLGSAGNYGPRRDGVVAVSASRNSPAPPRGLSSPAGAGSASRSSPAPPRGVLDARTRGAAPSAFR
jgi:probable HAF family extracellular repeat protein